MLTYNEATESLWAFFNAALEEWLPIARGVADEAEKACTTYLEEEIQPHIKGLGEEEVETFKTEKEIFEYDALIEKFEEELNALIGNERSSADMDRTHASMMGEI